MFLQLPGDQLQLNLKYSFPCYASGGEEEKLAGDLQELRCWGLYSELNWLSIKIYLSIIFK